jgi:hypothetical protein
MQTSTLGTLLDASLNTGPEYGGGMSNHLPMALHALHALGAGAPRLQAFSAVYAPRLAARAAPASNAKALPADWRDARGDFAAFDSLRLGFETLLRDQGHDATLRALLPALWPGAAGAAFHGLIRTAHAVQSGHQRELAAALAYWAARWKSLPAAPAPPAPVAFAEWAARLEAAALGTRLPGRSITGRIDAVVQAPQNTADAAYAAWADATALEGLMPLSDWAAGLYARSGNFTVLHLVTATRAARVLWPWTTARGEVLQGLLRAVTAAVLASNLQPAAPLGPDECLPAWPQLIEAAMASDDDHVIKLVHALVEERAAYGEGQRRQAAARTLGWPRAALSG